MNRRFHYVWQHFQSLYQVPAGITVAYGEGEGQVSIEAYRGAFFEGQAPWPPDIDWQRWQGQQVPFPFAPESPRPLFTAADGKVTIHYDIIAAAFYFLSGWQEYHSTDRDRFDRFPYKSSLQYKLGIATLPVVNYYFDILRCAIEKAANQPIIPRFNEKGTFSVCLTHDIDNSESAWKTAGRAALQQADLSGFLKLLFARLKGRDAWFNWTSIARQIREAGGTSTFFFLCQDQAYQGTRNADYNISRPKYQHALKALENEHAEIALHGSLEAAVAPTQFFREKEKLPATVKGNRFHYLRFDPRQTPDLLQAAGIAYDSTLGFAEHYGFRHGYCFPFRLFNFQKQQPYDFLEIPLTVMDTTLDHPHYLQLKGEEVLPALRPLLAEIQKFGGCFTLLWHNENFTLFKKNNGLEVFNQLLTELKARRANFLSCGALHDQFAPLFQQNPNHWLP